MSPEKESIAEELFDELIGAETEFQDPRIRYVSVQLDRDLWLRIQALPR